MRLVRTVAATAVAVALLTSCSDGETANETLPSASSSAAETSESLPPLGPPDMPMPAEAREKTEAGAEAFLWYYVDLLNYSKSNRTTDFLRTISPNCDSCLKFAAGIDDVAAAGQTIQGASFVLNGASPPLIDNDTAEFSMSLTQQSSELLDSSGNAMSDFSQPEVAYPGSGMRLQWSPPLQTWLTEDLAFQ